MAEFKPYVSPDERLAEFTWRGWLPGILLGIVFGMANAYIGLRAGLTISTSIPIAVLTVAAYRLAVRGNILEANMSQTIGSASSSVASGVIFTLPALFLWGLEPSLLQMTLLALAGGVLGTLFMIPLRKFLIEREHATLPYPEGTACAEVLVASQGGGRSRGVFEGIIGGALIKTIVGGFRLVPDEIDVRIPFLRKGHVGAEVSAALFGVGFILGPKVGAVMVSGGLLASLVIIPLLDWWGQGMTAPVFPELKLTIAEMSPGQLWNRYVRYIGAGAVAAAGIITLVRSIPTMMESFRVGLAQLRRRATDHDFVPRTSHDLRFSTTIVGAICVVALLTVVPQAFGTLPGFTHRLVAAVLVAIFAFFFATVSSRIVGFVGVTSNPTSGMTIAALLGTAAVFLAMGWTDMAGKAGALTVGTVVAISASIAGDTSQDLKTGYLLGATPRYQQIGQLLGVLTSAAFVCMAVLILGEAHGFGSEEVPAPQATLMKLVIEGVLDRTLPWGLVAIGVGITIVAALLRLPPLAFAVGVYLPVAAMVPILFGGLLRMWVDRSKNAQASADHGVLVGSGLVAGEGLVGVGIAFVAWRLERAPEGFGYEWAGSAAPLAAAALFLILIAWFAVSLRAAGRARAAETPPAS